MPEASSVRAMFARIAGRYDLLNRVLSLGIDRRWRRRAVRRAEGLAGGLAERLVVDACCGTADLCAAFARTGARCLGLDFTPEMLRGGRRKVRGRTALLAAGDALRLPLRSGCAALVSVAFGIRNVEDPRAALLEFARVLAPGGHVLVLEFSTPRGRVLGPLYRFYFTRVLPRVGGLLSGDRGAYAYLPATVLAWPEAAEFQGWMEAAGLLGCDHERLSLGIACLHWGQKPGAVG